MTLKELIKDCDTDLQKQIIELSIKSGIEYIINYGGITSTIYLPDIVEYKLVAFLDAVYGYPRSLCKISFNHLSLDEQRKRIRSLKVRCGRHNDLWNK